MNTDNPQKLKVTVCISRNALLIFIYHGSLSYCYTLREVQMQIIIHSKFLEVMNQKVSQFSHSVMSNSLWPHGLQHARLPCPSPTPRTCSNSWPLSRWCHPTISSSVVPFSSCLHSFPASGSFPMNWFFASGGQSIGVSAQHQSFQWIFRNDFL